MVGLFFLFLFYKYATLHPQIDVRQRLPICPPASVDGDERPCVAPDQVDDAAHLYRVLVNLIESYQTCDLAPDGIERETTTEDANRGSVTVGQLKSNLAEMSVDSNEYEQEQRRGAAGKNQDDLLSKLVKILDENSELGIRVLQGPEENGTELALIQPRVQWSCWFWQKIQLAFYYGAMMTWWALLVGGILVLGYVFYRLYVWNQERILREKQDVFELVEQVLSLLVSQHQVITN